MTSKRKKDLVRKNGHSYRNFSHKESKKEKKYYPQKETKKDKVLSMVKRLISY